MNKIEQLSMEIIRRIYVFVLWQGFSIWAQDNEIILWQNFGQCWTIENNRFTMVK